MSIITNTSIYIDKSNIRIEGKDVSTGNGVFANRNFRAGEQVATLDRPLVGSLDAQYLHNTCANCYVWTEGSSTGARLYVPEGVKVQKCAGCQRFRYCSKACQKDAWNRGHKHECKTLLPHVDREIPKAVLACMELLIRRKHGLISNNDWETLCRLPSHIETFKQNGSYGNIELMAMGASQFSLTQNMFNRDFVATMYARVLTNSLTLITPTLDPLGIILDPVLGNLNHSCDPNIFIMMDGPRVSVRTLKPVKSNEELYISYIDTTNPYYRRQSELKARWFFDCQCTKCEEGARLSDDNWVIKPANLSQSLRDIADQVFQDGSFSQDPANYVGDSKDEQRVAAIQWRAFRAYEATQRLQDPKSAVEAIEDAMQMCRDSGLWTVCRQPYAALRDDLIVNLLSIENYSSAWAHCAKRFVHIHPVLYPVPFHPVRVVQTWQMAILAAYIASTPEGIGAPGVNMGLIAMMLVRQVLDASHCSHREGSAFAMSVKRKAEEMIEELKRTLGGNADRETMNRELGVQRDLLRQVADQVQI